MFTEVWGGLIARLPLDLKYRTIAKVREESYRLFLNTSARLGTVVRTVRAQLAEAEARERAAGWSQALDRVEEKARQQERLQRQEDQPQQFEFAD